MLAGDFPISKVLLLDQTVLDQITKLILLRGSRNRSKFLRSPHSDEFLILDKRERRLLVHQDLL
jgi:hypothetical protein